MEYFVHNEFVGKKLKINKAKVLIVVIIIINNARCLKLMNEENNI